MSISMNHSQQHQPHSNYIIAEEVLAISQLHAAEQEKLTLVKQFLDRHFPLNTGSHQDVSSYVVYYQHLLAFFADGSHSGLRQTKQFVAFNGTKEAPSAIVLQDQGRHVELCFDRSGLVGTRNLAHLEDVQIEAASTPKIETHRSMNSRHWLSLLHAGMPANDTLDKHFTAKDGGDYQVQHIANL